MPKIAFLAVLTATLAGCSVLGASGEEAYREERAALVAQLESAARAEATTLQACRVAPVGARACGGPSDYVVYSATSADTAAVRSLAAAIGRLDQDANLRFGLVSTCEFREPPTVAIEGGRCVAR